jgi:hypothetical protein
MLFARPGLPLFASFLLSMFALAGTPQFVAIVLLAKDATVNSRTGSSDLSNGSNLYSGEFLKTGPAGLLRLRSGKLQLALEADTQLAIYRSGDSLRVVLSAGSLNYSGEDPTLPLFILAGAELNIIFATRSVGQVRIRDACTVSVAVAQGALESRTPKPATTVRAGEHYLIHLSSQENPACGTRSPPPPPMQPPPYEKVIGGGFVLITVIAVIKAWESPDSP